MLYENNYDMVVCWVETISMIPVENEILNCCKTGFKILDFLWRKTCNHSLSSLTVLAVILYTN